MRTVASVGYLFTLNYDARNHELKVHTDVSGQPICQKSSLPINPEQ